VVFTISKIIRPFSKYNRALLSDLCLAAVRALWKYTEIPTDSHLIAGVVAVIHTFGDRLNFHPHLHMLVTEDGRTGGGSFHAVPIFDDTALTPVFAREVLAFPGWRKLIKKVYEVDPLTCPACGAQMEVIVFITDYPVKMTSPCRFHSSYCTTE
jgi:hypothetical protein